MANSALDISKPSLRSQTSDQSLRNRLRNKRKKRKVKDTKLVLTQGFIDRLETTGKRVRYYDEKIHGLILEVMASGSKIFRLRLTKEYKDEVATIGKWPETSLETARDEAQRLSGRLTDESFRQKRKLEREELTLREVSNLYFDLYADEYCKTSKDMRRNFANWFASDLDLQLSEITRPHIQTRVIKLKDGTHHHRANRALESLRAIYNWAIEEGHTSSNPTLGIKQYKEEARTRFLQEEEREAFFKAVSEYPDERIQDFIYLALFTGARMSNVLSMRWDQIDLNTGLWRVPGSTTKTGESLNLGLSQLAIDVLKRRSANRELIPWVFPGGGKGQKGVRGKTGYLKFPRKGWNSIVKSAGLKDLHIHDLRRTSAVIALEQGIPTAVVQVMLGHKTLAAAQVYQQASVATTRKAFNEVSNALAPYLKQVAL